MARKSARAAAVQMVFENMLGGDGGEDTLRGLIEFSPEGEDQDFIDGILAGVEAHGEELDQAIEKNLKAGRWIVFPRWIRRCCGWLFMKCALTAPPRILW